MHSVSKYKCSLEPRENLNGMKINPFYQWQFILFMAQNGLSCADVPLRNYALTQWQKCSLGNIVSDTLRFVQIFARVLWTGGVK